MATITAHPPRCSRAEHNRLVCAFGLDKAGSASTWHVGGTWRNPPFNIESLTNQVVPGIGGHTLWADLQAAYDGLSEPFKELVRTPRHRTTSPISVGRQATS